MNGKAKKTAITNFLKRDSGEGQLTIYINSELSTKQV
jgi:hypothetical protein